MIDRKDPEIHRYLEKELQKQKEKITERIIWQNLTKPHFIGPTPEDVKYATELSEEEIRRPSEEEAEEKYQQALRETKENDKK